MLSDFHNDILTAGGDLRFLQDANCAVLALYQGERTMSELFAIACDFAAKNTNPNYRLAFEEISEITDGELERLISFRPAYVTLTWNFENDLAHGCLSSGRLKPRGKEIVRRLTERNVPIDTAHLCKQSFYDVSDATDLLVNSHTCFSAIHFHPRNIDDGQLAILRGANAPVGLALVGSFLTDGRAGYDEIVRQIDHYVQKFGTDGICFGTDFYGTKDLPHGIQNYKSLYELVEKFLKIGYNIEVIEKIFYHNLKNFLNGRKTE